MFFPVRSKRRRLELIKVTHKLHLPFPRIPVPEWWVALPNR